MVSSSADRHGTDRQAEAERRGISLTLRARVLVQTGLQFLGKIATMASGLVLFAILTRYLGVAGFGRYTFVLGYVSIFAVLTDLGAQAIAVREMSRHSDSADRVAGQFFTLKSIMAATAAASALLLAYLAPVHSLTDPGVRLGIVICSVALLTGPFGGTANAVFQMRLRMQVPVLADVFSRLGVLACVALLATGAIAIRHTPAASLDAVLLVSSVLGGIGSVVTFVAAGRLLRLRPVLYDRQLLWPMVRDAVPLAVVLVVGMIHYRIDVFILSAIKGNAAVGLYGVATKLLDVSLAISAMFMSVAFPVLSQRALGDRQLLQRAFQKSFDFMFVLGAGIAVFAATLAPLAVRIVGGSHFHGSVAPLAIIAWAVPVMFINQVVSHMVVAANRQYAGVPIVAGATLANVLLNVLLIPRLGAVGPAIVTDITETVTAVGMGIIMSRHFGFGPAPGQAIRVVLATAITAAVTLLLYRVSPFVALVGGPAAYGALLLALGVLSRDDVTALLHRRVPELESYAGE